MNKTTSLTLILLILLSFAVFSPSVNQVTAATIPTIRILSVVQDQSVTIQTANYPADQTFEVRMGEIGTRGINGILITTVQSGSGGTFDATFTIPPELHGERQIAIRLESPTSGYFSYNWFWNNTATIATTPIATSPAQTATPGVTPTPRPTAAGTVSPTQISTIPTISIVSVIRDQSVTIETANYPADRDFEVRMGKIGTRGVGGILVTVVNSGSGGSFRSTFTIPPELQGDSLIAIRLESPTSGHFSYNWFWNRTTE